MILPEFLLIIKIVHAKPKVQSAVSKFPTRFGRDEAGLNLGAATDGGGEGEGEGEDCSLGDLGGGCEVGGGCGSVSERSKSRRSCDALFEAGGGGAFLAGGGGADLVGPVEGHNND